jgi:hypothetical protein
MSYRFLPWVRRGLASEITERDDLGSGLPARASFPVRLRTTGGDASTRLRLYGPGDVVGIDTRSIVRTEPRRGTGNFAPNQFASIEFDPPGFAWMFTPGRADARDRLRPWLVLVVVENKEGIHIRVRRDSPLPQLTIEAPAQPGMELPDLADSWAWAHAQMVEDNGGGDVADRLEQEPDLSVSRLVCPRRLQPNRSYFGCVVPAFDAGRRSGLGEEGPESATTTRAWGEGGGIPPEIVLPLYYHWEFRTGPEGDFEALARKLTPTALPGEVGSRAMFIGNADRALPELPATREDGGILQLEGALRAPTPGPEVELGAEHEPFLAALKSLLDAVAAHVDDGAPTSAVLPAENVAPPIYGSWHTRTHVVPDEGQLPKWLRDLNVDARHRAAAGLGTEVVKANQERYMDAAWEQVGDVINANQALNIARLIDVVTRRMLNRHIQPLDAVSLFSLTAPMHARTILGNLPLAKAIGRSVMPVGVSDPSFRRQASPQNNVLKRAARFAPGAVPVDGTVQTGVMQELAAGGLAIDFDIPVDGLTSSSLIDRLPPAQDGMINGETIGLVGSVRTSDVDQVVAARDDLAIHPVSEVTVRPDIAITGVLLDRHLDRIAGATAPERPLGEILRELLARSRANRGAVGFLIFPDGEEIEVLELGDEGLLRARSVTGSTREVASLDPSMAMLGVAGVRSLIGRLPEGMFDPEGTGPMITDVRLDVGTGEAVEPFIPVRGGPPTTTLDPPATERQVVVDFVNAYQQYAMAAKLTATSLVPAPMELDLLAVGAHLIKAIDPQATILARAGTRITVGSALLSELIAPDRFHHDEDLGPILVGPIIPEPLYQDLANYDQNRFLPGAGVIPANSITLLETNPRFVEAFLVGTNHEMNRELLWRGFPAVRQGTPFRVFWDRLDGQTDIGPIDRFARNRRLGSNGVGSIEGSIVLLVRGDLLRRYPNSIVYATPSRPDRKLDQDPALIEMPIFGGKLDPDITFVGFDLTVEQISPEPGWFFVIQEQPTEPRFGLDEPNGSAAALTTWSDLTWAHVGVAPGGHLPLAAMAASLDLNLGGPGSPKAKWRQDAAHMAAITFQRPFRAAVHGSDVLAAQNGSPGEV